MALAAQQQQQQQPRQPHAQQQQPPPEKQQDPEQQQPQQPAPPQGQRHEPPPPPQQQHLPVTGWQLRAPPPLRGPPRPPGVRGDWYAALYWYMHRIVEVPDDQLEQLWEALIQAWDSATGPALPLEPPSSEPQEFPPAAMAWVTAWLQKSPTAQELGYGGDYGTR